jgi:hypothetical protein
MVALYQQAHPRPQPEHRSPTPDERPQPATAPQQVWFVDLPYLVQIAGQRLSSILIFAGDRRAIVGAGCCERHNFSRVLQVFQRALTQWGAPEAIVSDHGAVWVALALGLRQRDIPWSPPPKGYPWHNRAESGFAIQRRMLDASVVGCTAREQVDQRHAQCVQESQCWGHWAHKRRDAQGRVYYLSPEVILGQARGRALDPLRVRRALRLRQLTRTVVSYPCVSDPRQRRITAGDARGRQQYGQAPVLQLVLWALALGRTVWRMPRYHRTTPPRRVLLTLQMRLFPPFTT